MMTIVHCYCFTASQLLSGSNGELTKNVFILHYGASKMVDFDQLAKQ